MTPAERAGRAEHVHHVGRQVENWGLAVGLALGLLYGLSEIVIHVVVSLGMRPYTPTPFPWIIVMFFLGCILPKTLGRVTTGRVWVLLAQGVARMLARGRGDGHTGMTTLIPALKREEAEENAAAEGQNEAAPEK